MRGGQWAVGHCQSGQHPGAGRRVLHPASLGSIVARRAVRIGIELGSISSEWRIRHLPAISREIPPRPWDVYIGLPLTSSLWSAPAPRSRRGNSSNDPTDQEVISKSRDSRSTSRAANRRSSVRAAVLTVVGKWGSVLLNLKFYTFLSDSPSNPRRRAPVTTVSFCSGRMRCARRRGRRRRSRGLLVEHEHDFALPTRVALGAAHGVFPVLEPYGPVDACAERAVGDQVHQIAVGAVH